jgi:hypothetical protein
MSQQQKKRPDTPLAETPVPDYRNIQKTKKGILKDKPYTATAKDSSDYREGFERGVAGKNKLFPSSSSVRGYNEAKDRNLIPKKNKR